jgi:hypothetical protein
MRNLFEPTASFPKLEIALQHAGRKWGACSVRVISVLQDGSLLAFSSNLPRAHIAGKGD